MSVGAQDGEVYSWLPDARVRVPELLLGALSTAFAEHTVGSRLALLSA